MGFLTKLPVVFETQDPDVARLTEVEAGFSDARVQFNSVYQRFFDYHKTHKTSPFLALVDHRVSIEFQRETGEGKELAVDVTKKRQRFHALMAERASLLQKLGRIR
jgi:hypothetical protein